MATQPPHAGTLFAYRPPFSEGRRWEAEEDVHPQDELEERMAELEKRIDALLLEMDPGRCDALDGSDNEQ